MTKEEARIIVKAQIDWFRQDLAYTAPELHEMKWKRFEEIMDHFIDRMFEE